MAEISTLAFLQAVQEEWLARAQEWDLAFQRQLFEDGRTSMSKPTVVFYQKNNSSCTMCINPLRDSVVLNPGDVLQVTVEKAPEPPKPVFKPGDVVKNTATATYGIVTVCAGNQTHYTEWGTGRSMTAATTYLVQVQGTLYLGRGTEPAF